MENDNITLKLYIAQRPITLTIKKEWECYYKEAEKVINDSFLKFAKKWNYTDHQDLLSKILIDFVVKWIENEERVNEYEQNLVPMMEKLNTLAGSLEVDK